MKTAALYVRVSTVEQRDHGLSVDSQIDALQKYCEANGYSVFKIYNDAGLSARKKYTQRPALMEMIEDAKQSRFSIVLFTKLDRFFRSIADYYAVQSVLDAQKIPWRAIWEDYETETSAGIFKVNIMLSIAQAESDRTSERIKAVNEYRKDHGAYVGSAPTGYVLNKKDLLKDEATKEGVEAFFIEFLKTKNMKRSIDAAKKHGVNLSRECARHMLKSETYCGNAFGYSCEPYITEEQHEMLVSVVESRRTRMPKRGEHYMFSGILYCGKCGKNAYASHVHNSIKGKKYEYTVYKCRGAYDLGICEKHRCFFEKKLEDAMLNYIKQYLDSYEVSEIELKESSDYESKKAALESKLKRIGVRFEDGDISVTEYREKRDSIKHELAMLIKPSKKTALDLPENWFETYNNLNNENKKLFWSSIVKTIYVNTENRKYILTVDFI